MFCNRCGASYNDAEEKCPYCGLSTCNQNNYLESVQSNLNFRLSQIDELFGIQSSYTEMDNYEILNYFDSLNEKLDKCLSENKDIMDKLNIIDVDMGTLKKDSIHIYDILDCCQNNNNTVYSVLNDKLKKVVEHIDEVNEYLQSKKPIRGNISTNNIGIKGADLVYYYLDNIVPPDVYTAAFKLRSLNERKISDYYKFKKDEDGRSFTLSYYNIYLILTKNKEVARKLVEGRNVLNMFVHADSRNDKLLKLRFNSIDDEIKFIKDLANMFKKYKLI